MSTASANIGSIEDAGNGRKVIHASFSGAFGADDAKLLQDWADNMGNAVKKASDGRTGSVGIIIDVSKLEGYDNPEIITILSKLMQKDQPYVYRTATWGGSYNVEMAQQVIQSLANRDNLKNFKNESDALEWLKSPVEVGQYR